MAEELETKTDEEVLAFSLKQPAVFEILVNRYQATFLKTGGRILGNTAAEDAVQDTFVKIYLNAGRFQVRVGASFKSWAYRILLNTCYTAYQKVKRERAAVSQVDAAVLAATVGDPRWEHQADKIFLEQVLTALSRLPVILGRIFDLHCLQGKSSSEIAVLENISENLVRVRLHRAKKELRKLTPLYDEYR
ncbi:MAG: RNA polymerase sigma factor [Candidatus Vogelbacteria bacterium]|nr:RNA polymerase sigma factor [Candidatus Vogelbacteria bacterium]